MLAIHWYESCIFMNLYQSGTLFPQPRIVPSGHGHSAEEYGGQTTNRAWHLAFSVVHGQMAGDIERKRTMAETVNVEIPHRLTRVEARQRLEGGLQRMHEQIAGRAVEVEQQWVGDHLDFKAAVMGQTITGRLDVEDNCVRLELDLPWLLASIANTIKGKLKKEATLLLEKK